MYFEHTRAFSHWDIKRILVEHYWKYWGATPDNIERELSVQTCYDPDFDGATVFTLRGSPPKGYAIYSSRRLWFFNPAGRRFANWENVKVKP